MRIGRRFGVPFLLADREHFVFCSLAVKDRGARGYVGRGSDSGVSEESRVSKEVGKAYCLKFLFGIKKKKKGKK